ncbi:MAG: hypothetical protein ACYCZT_00775 [Thiobacillus sp.]
MSDRSPDTQDTPLEATQSAEINSSRRKLTGAALGASAIFTLASRPVLAGVCQSPSAAVSGNLSQHGTPTTCSGLSPGYWKEKSGSWPSSYDHGTASAPSTSSNGNGNGNDFRNQAENWSGGTLFHPTFVGSRFMADFDSNPNTEKTSLSMMQVMVMNDGNNRWGLKDPDNLGAHIVAALLNAEMGYTTGVLSEAQVINMWSEWVSKGYFEPTASVKWYSADIVRYIKTTFV